MKKLLVAVVALAAFAVGYGVVAKAYPSPWPYGRAQYHGYFTNANDTNGTYVLPNVYGGYAFPGWIYSGNNNTFANNFIAFVESQLGGNNQQRSGASFIIQTMLPGGSRNRPPTGGEIASWENLVRQYAAANKVGQSVNFCYNLNSYFQGSTGGGGTNDDAFYDGGGCAVAIVFYNTDGTQYAIKHLCANPVGNATLHPLNPVSNWAMSGRTVVDYGTRYPGQTVNFWHYVKNNGPTSTNGQHIWFAILDGTTGATIQGGQDSGAYNAGEEKFVSGIAVTIPNNAPPGSKICEKVLYDWADSGGGRNGTGASACVTVLDITPGCGSATTTPGTFDPTDSYTAGAYVNIAGGAAGATYVDGQSNFFMHVTGPGVNYVNDNVTPTTISTNGANGVITVAQGMPPTNNAGNYTVSYGIVGPVSAITCSGSFRVNYTPYFSAMEGDVTAGPGFGTGGACLPSLSSIKAKNRGLVDNYYGAGSQLGAFALNHITNFASGITRNSGSGKGTNSLGGAVTQPWNLTFSNVGPPGLSNAVDSPWGNTFGKDPTDDTVSNSTSCVPDYYATAKVGAPDITSKLTTLPDGNLRLGQGDVDNGSIMTSGNTYFINGNLETAGGGGGWLYFGGGSPSRITLVVKGDVYINSHIAYRPYSYVSGVTNASSIPQFQLIVQGNIYVSSGTTFLAGFYDAQASGASGGTIYTCSTNRKYLTNKIGDAAPNAQQDPNYYADCSNPLTVSGSFAAKGLKLNRSHGNLKQTPTVDNGPAELFVYAPELWMGDLNSSVPSGGAQPFDAITNLPPIL